MPTTTRTRPTSRWLRAGSLAAVIAVPALAVAVFGGSAVTAGTPGLPGAWQVEQTRAFNRAGQNLSVPATATNSLPADQAVETFLNTWQNTARPLPSPIG